MATPVSGWTTITGGFFGTQEEAEEHEQKMREAELKSELVEFAELYNDRDGADMVSLVDKLLERYNVAKK